MKTGKIGMLLSVILVSLFIVSCQNDKEIITPQDTILPEKFKVDIPSALSHQQFSMMGRVAVDTLDGNAIYQHLTNFIAVGDEAANIVQDIIFYIAVYHINHPISLSFQGNEDGRTKNLEVIENSSFDGKDWEFQLTITDSESEGNEDGGNAIQIFWNRNPIQGIAILKPYNINRELTNDWAQGVFRIDYSEAGESGYDATMTVQVASLPLAEPLENPYSMKSLKMFAGKNGDIIDLYGNSNHPNAIFFSGNAGFNWAFVASGNKVENIGVAEVGLPPSNLDEPVRNVLLEEYSIKNVFVNEIYSVWPDISDDVVQAYLYNTDAPGFFNQGGFITGGTSPGTVFDALVPRLDGLSPFNPKAITNLDIAFK